MTVHVLFVCLGNICRSPMAEAVFHKMVEEAGLSDRMTVDSAGTGAWHVGEQAHSGTRRVLTEHGVQYSGRARQIQASDFSRDQTYIVAMDESNLHSIQHRFGSHPRLYQLLEFASEATQRRNGLDVPDPYYDGNFEQVYQLVVEGCQGLLSMIRDKERLHS